MSQSLRSRYRPLTLAVVLCYPSRANKALPLTLAWTTLATAIATFACFAESAKRITDGNFGWGQMIAGHILFLVSLDFLMRQPGSIRRVFCLSVLFLHALSGVAYFVRS